MGTREILTLQFGHYSNFVGSHWWNIQETGFDYNATEPSEINHDVLFREGLTDKGHVTYTPRLLLVDLKGCLGTLPQSGKLYEPLEEPSKAETLWNDVEVQTSEPELKNEFQEQLIKSDNVEEVLKKKYKLDDEVNVWSDFLYSRFHPRTINIISQYSHKQNSHFHAFSQGRTLWNCEQFSENFSDKIRNYIEECDNFQGFHVILDSINGFSGLGSACMQHIEEEYERKPIIAFPVIPSYYPSYDKVHGPFIPDSFRTLNTAFCFAALNEHSSLFVPLSTSSSGWSEAGPKRLFNHVFYNHKLYYHTGAILASALDTFTLKYRVKTSKYTLKDLCADFTNNSRKVAAASLCLPFPINNGSYFIDCLDNWDGPLTKSITPNCSIGTDKLVQMFTLRGIPETRLKKPLVEDNLQQTMPAYNCKSVNEMLSYYLSCNYFFCLNNVTNVAKGISVRTPYPHIFDEFVGGKGIRSSPKTRNLKSVPILAGLHSGSSVGDMIENLYLEAKKTRRGELRQYAGLDMEPQDISDCLESLLELKECYEDNYL